MRSLAAGIALAALAAAGTAMAGTEAAPLYTNEDLDRMFGPPPHPVSEPVDKSTPEDWRWVEQYLDRQYARIDADRQYDLSRAALRIADQQSYYPYYGSYPVAWNASYPMATWWQTVHARYSAALAGDHQPRVEPRGGL